MHSTQFAAVSLTLALCFSPSYRQAQSQQVQSSTQAPEAAERARLLTPAPASETAAGKTVMQVAWKDGLAYHSPIESSSRAEYTEAFAHAAPGETDAGFSPKANALLGSRSEMLGSKSEALGARSKMTYAREDKLSSRPFSKLAVGVKVSTLGAGLELATPLARRLNLRAGINYAVFGYNFNLDGIDYSTHVNFRSAQMSLDWFPFHGGFHISPGFLYFKNGLSGQANVPPGQRFSLEDTDYINSVDDPVSGTASVSFDRKAAPMLTLGWGNLLPRSGRHFSVPFEFGVAYSGAAKIDVKLAGTACTRDGCFNAALDRDTQNNLNGELKDINDQAAKYPIFPIVSLGFAYRF